MLEFTFKSHYDDKYRVMLALCNSHRLGQGYFEIRGAVGKLQLYKYYYSILLSLNHTTFKTPFITITKL